MTQTPKTARAPQLSPDGHNRIAKPSQRIARPSRRARPIAIRKIARLTAGSAKAHKNLAVTLEKAASAPRGKGWAFSSTSKPKAA